jgi:hypothetical protein
VPAGIYLGLGISFVGSFVFAIALAMTSGGIGERFDAVARWQLLEAGTFVAQTLLVSCGLLELARRHTGPARVLTRLAAGLLLVTLAWSLVTLAITIVQPSDLLGFYKWFGRGIGVLALAGAIVLTIGADAWRRVPVAATGLLLLHVTSYWVPGVSDWINDLLGQDLVLQRVYALVREGLGSTALLFVAASLAAGGRDLAPDRRAAVGGFRLAYGALVFRVVAAIVLAMIAVVARSADARKLLVMGAPLVSIGTLLVFTLGLQSLAGSRLLGLPRIRLHVASAILLTWIGIQLYQLPGFYGSLGEDHIRTEDLALFSILGPLAVTLALALVGSAVSAYASSAGAPGLASTATMRTGACVVLSLVAVGIPTLPATALPSPIILAVVIAIAGVVAVAVFAGIFRQAAAQVEAGPGLPAARVL